MRALVIDDDPDIRQIASFSLSRLGGLEVLEAESGGRGVELARSEQPDFILLDVMMPTLDGPATLARLRADPSTASIPVIFLTAKAMSAELARLRSLGAAGVLTKPFDPMVLAEQVRALLSRAP